MGSARVALPAAPRYCRDGCGGAVAAVSEPWRGGLDGYQRQALADHLGLIERFLAGDLAAAEFAPLFQRRVSDSPVSYGADSRAFAVLDAFWHDCEEFIEDPALRGPGDFDEAELMRRAHRAREDLAALLAG
jgi:hypothetical protein